MRALVDASVLLRFPLPSRNPARAVDLIADFLVTGDRDLLALAPAYDPPRIVIPGAFVSELRARGLVAQ